MAKEWEAVSSTLLKEFEEWSNNYPSSEVYLLETKYSEDDRSIALQFSIGGEHEFLLHCPQSFNSSEDRFIIEASPVLSSWSSSINEYLLESPVMLRLPDVLTKVVELYAKHQQMAGNRAESNYTSEEEMEEDEYTNESVMSDDEYTTEWELNLARIKKRWVQKEAELRKSIKEARSNSGGYGNHDITPKDKQQANQIFSTIASSGVLTNDLVTIMQKQHEIGISADPLDDNIYCWIVRMSNFQPGSDLQKDLDVVKQRFGYDYIELQLDFTMDLYPFYPPQVKVIRPRLHGAMMQRVSNMELLKLSFWNPISVMLNVLNEIKNFLQQWARLEATSSRNSLTDFPEGAYVNLEHHLLRLAMVSEVQPRANAQYVFQVEKRLNEPKVAKPADEKSGVARQYWAQGTGYGYGNRPGWDVQAYIAAQKLKDEQVDAVLNDILSDLRSLGRTRGGSNGESSEFMSNSVSSIPEGELFEIVEGSALIPFLETKLQESSLLEICRHALLYTRVLDVIKEICNQRHLIKLLGPLPKQSNSIQQHLQRLKDQAAITLTRMAKLAENPLGALQVEPGAAKIVNNENEEGEKLARLFVTVNDEVTDALAGLGEDGDSFPNQASQKTNEAVKSDEELYCDNMKKLQFANLPFTLEGPDAHFHGRHYLRKATHSPTQMFRIAQELSSLSSSLPLNLSSSIFLRVDEEKCTLLRALITGPEDTPYSGGCFVFDIFFPDKYPSGPPMVQLLTTGSGMMRFNPNLYACGKVCLSLLGTWEGREGEKWNENTSTLLQVLVSIQSLIMVPEPYFNEPGYEAEIGTQNGKNRSEAYNQNIRYGTVKYAMIDQLRSPPSGYEEVIKNHFTFQKARILKEVGEWAAVGGVGNKLRTVYNQLEAELQKLNR